MVAGYGKDGKAATHGDEWFRPVGDGDDEDAGTAPPWAVSPAAGITHLGRIKGGDRTRMP